MDSNHEQDEIDDAISQLCTVLSKRAVNEVDAVSIDFASKTEKIFVIIIVNIQQFHTFILKETEYRIWVVQKPFTAAVFFFMICLQIFLVTNS